MGVLKSISLLVAVVAACVGLVGKFAPHLFMALPMGFIPWAITGHPIPPYLDNMFLANLTNFREFVRDGDVVVSVGAKSGTTWMCFCADAIRRKGATEDAATGLKPYTDIMYTTPWLECSQRPGETWAERSEFYKTHVLPDGTKLSEYWDHPSYPFRVFKSHFSPDTTVGGNPYDNVLPVTTFPKVKYLTMVRNGHQVSKSWYYFVDRHRDEFRKAWGSFPPPYPSLDAAIRDILPGGNVGMLYFPYVKAWWALRDEPNVLLMHYTDATRDLPATVAKLAAFYGVELTEAETSTVATTCGMDHMTANEDMFNYRLPMFPEVGQIMKSASFINKVDMSKVEASPETLALWEKACMDEFPDERLRRWAAEGGGW